MYHDHAIFLERSLPLENAIQAFTQDAQWRHTMDTVAQLHGPLEPWERMGKVLETVRIG